MATESTSIYVTAEVKTKLDRLSELEHRKIIDEIDFLATERLRELGEKPTARVDDKL